MSAALFPARYAGLRPDHDQDIKATLILGMKIEEGSAKIRTGGPIDEESGYALPIWAGVVAVETRIGTPIPDPRNLTDLDAPKHVTAFEGGYCADRINQRTAR